MPTKMRKENLFYIRKTEGACWREINQLYQLVTGKVRNQEQYAWEWFDNPKGIGSMWVVREKGTERIVGHHGLIPIAFNCYGLDILAGKTENTMVHPDYRRKVFYPAFERKAFDDAKKQFDLLFTTAGGGGPGAIRRRLGYELVGNWDTYLLKASRRFSLLTIPNRQKMGLGRWSFARLLRLGIYEMCSIYRALFHRPPIDYRLIEIRDHSDFAEKLSRFWKDNRRYFGIAPDRNKGYLEWRIKNNPYITYRTYEFTNDQGACGYAIARNRSEYIGGRKVVSTFVEDIVVSRNDEKTYVNCINKLIIELKTSDIIACKTLDLHNSLTRALNVCRLLPYRFSDASSRKNLTPFYAFYGANISNRDWFITQLLMEGVSN